MTLSFFFSNFYFFTLKDFFVFNFLCTANIVCILHMFLGFFFFGLRIYVLSVTVVKKATRGGGNMNTKSREETIIRMLDALLLCFCLPWRNPTRVSSCEFCYGCAEMSTDQGWRSTPGRRTRVHFYRGAFSLPKINSKAHSFCHRKGRLFLSFFGEPISFANSW